jgi:hypothetical protein
MEKLSSIESQEKPARYRTIERKILETLPSGESLEEVLECNGTHHRREIDFVDQMSREELGECDHSHS